MYYNCGIAIAKRQTKLKLSFIIQCVCPHRPAKTEYGLPGLFSIFSADSVIPWLFQVFQASAHPDINNSVYSAEPLSESSLSSRSLQLTVSDTADNSKYC